MTHTFSKIDLKFFFIKIIFKKSEVNYFQFSRFIFLNSKRWRTWSDDSSLEMTHFCLDESSVREKNVFIRLFSFHTFYLLTRGK